MNNWMRMWMWMGKRFLANKTLFGQWGRKKNSWKNKKKPVKSVNNHLICLANNNGKVKVDMGACVCLCVNGIQNECSQLQFCPVHFGLPGSNLI